MALANVFSLVAGCVFSLLLLLNLLQCIATRAGYRQGRGRVRAESTIVSHAHAFLSLACASFACRGFASMGGNTGLYFLVSQAFSQLGILWCFTWMCVVAFQTLKGSFLSADVGLPCYVRPLMLSTWLVVAVATPTNLCVGFLTDMGSFWLSQYTAQFVYCQVLMWVMLIATDKLKRNLTLRDSGKHTSGRKKGLVSLLGNHLRLVVILSCLCSAATLLFAGLFFLRVRRPAPYTPSSPQVSTGSNISFGFSIAACAVLTAYFWVAISSTKHSSRTSHTPHSKNSSDLRATRFTVTSSPVGSPIASPNRLFLDGDSVREGTSTDVEVVVLEQGRPSDDLMTHSPPTQAAHHALAKAATG